MFETKGATKRHAIRLIEEFRALMETSEAEMRHTEALAKAMGGKATRLTEYNDAGEIQSACKKIIAISDGRFNHCLPADDER